MFFCYHQFQAGQCELFHLIYAIDESGFSSMVRFQVGSAVWSGFNIILRMELIVGLTFQQPVLSLDTFVLVSFHSVINFLCYQ